MTNAKHGGLGKGLGALLSERKPKGAVQEVAVEEIARSSGQPREDFDEAALAELAASISRYGVLQPLLVRRTVAGFELIAGERRLRAAKLAGLKKVPVLLREYSDEELSEVALIENLQREDLSPIEEARAYRRLVDAFHLTQEEIAARLGKSRPQIANTMRLLGLEDGVQALVKNGVLSVGQARPLLALPQEKQGAAADYIQEHDLTARGAEELVKRLLKEEKPAAPEKKPQENIFLRDAAEQLGAYLGTKVSIKSGARKSRLEIEFYSEDDLARLMELLEGGNKKSAAPKNFTV